MAKSEVFQIVIAGLDPAIHAADEHFLHAHILFELVCLDRKDRFVM
jgi:hypothetical protein